MARKTKDFTFNDAVTIWLLWWRGDKKHDIAARFSTNVARIYDVCKYETLYPGSRESALQKWQALSPA